MAAITTHPGLVMHEIAKRSKSWPAKNVGVMVVFCIVFVVAVALLAIFVSKCLKRRREAKPEL
ncbi:hypothetical protein ISF_09352 [Cordyceps fumosorosea ARSEF 2679]|uniref:Uncharacterized protein n=1 Tax=Cordyceps fumosorosea (strain ARSEF 2679) TaxID=1081104 RepID=A0A162KGC1_CORFA|nr:hypothetical protein ISF_09352 [Cordyceps fumosorosea ARSEF 2679]OAA50734.1 hypothetical protein ISF_09352 [Cordyceps fumosorosea ARSEF 2679]